MMMMMITVIIILMIIIIIMALGLERLNAQPITGSPAHLSLG